MSIYDRTRNGRPINPARALYDYWHTVLVGHPRTQRDADNRLKGSMSWGTSYGSISFHHGYDRNGPINTSDRPPIVSNGITLYADGTFRLGGFWGWKQRDNLARNTFLRWGHVHSEYVWYVDVTDQPGTYSAWPTPLTDWHNPVPYVGERVCAARNYMRPAPKLKLAWNEPTEQWAIAFAAPGEPGRHPNSNPITKKDFDWYLRLRAKRYDRYEHAVERALARQQRVVATSTEEQQQKALEVIIAHMDVGMAARTVPLRKTTEEVGLWELSGCP